MEGARAVFSVVAFAAAVQLSACRTDERRTLRVFSAVSLQEAFSEVAPDFGRQRAAAVRLHFAGSQELRRQLEHGAGADVFASADFDQLAHLHRMGLVGPPQRFACTSLVIAVPRGNPANVRSLRDLTRVERLVLAAPAVPAGRYTDALIAAEGLTGQLRPVSLELNVRQVLTKVLLGEADAAIVYRSDVGEGEERLEAISLPSSPTVSYGIAVVASSPHPALAQSFLERVVSGEEVLRRHGFDRCPPTTGG